MNRKTVIDGKIRSAHFTHSTTELIKAKKILELTGGRPIELYAEGKNCKLLIRLMATPSKVDFDGGFRVEINESIDEY